MREPFANEIRHLRPHLRRAMHLGVVAYRDQTKPVAVESEHDHRLRSAGQKMGFGGHQHLPEAYRVDVLVRDNLIRMPHFAPVNADVVVDKLDAE